jgi:hypothetical protein
MRASAPLYLKGKKEEYIKASDFRRHMEIS